MKRACLLLVILMLLCTATIILHASIGPENVEKTVARKPSPPVPIVSPLRPGLLQKRLPTAPRHASATPPVAKPPVSVPVASLRNFIEPATGMEFLQVPGGCFQMGDAAGDADEKPTHKVCLDGFYVGKYEVTQGEWQQVMGNRPSFFSSCGDNCPVESVSWNEVQEIIGKFNGLNGRTYRLLTEAEWEYVCRSGGKNEQFCGGNGVEAAAWYDKNSSSRPHPVGEKRPNGLGIYDMSGNVWEWVSDRFGKDYYGSSPPRNPEGALSGSKRVIRGGSWYNDSKNVRGSIRSSDEPDHRSINLGFRLAFSTR